MMNARSSERPRLSCAALLRNLLWGGNGFTARTHGTLLMEPDEYFIRRVLQTGVRLVKLPRSLRS